VKIYPELKSKIGATEDQKKVFFYTALFPHHVISLGSLPNTGRITARSMTRVHERSFITTITSLWILLAASGTPYYTFTHPERVSPMIYQSLLQRCTRGRVAYQNGPIPPITNIHDRDPCHP